MCGMCGNPFNAKASNRKARKEFAKCTEKTMSLAAAARVCPRATAVGNSIAIIDSSGVGGDLCALCG
jgi:hypothetical protein